MDGKWESNAAATGNYHFSCLQAYYYLVFKVLILYDHLNQAFQNFRSTKKERSRKATSTPQHEKSDTTIKFTDSNCHEDISRISEG